MHHRPRIGQWDTGWSKCDEDRLLRTENGKTEKEREMCGCHVAAGNRYDDVTLLATNETACFSLFLSLSRLVIILPSTDKNGVHRTREVSFVRDLGPPFSLLSLLHFRIFQLMWVYFLSSNISLSLSLFWAFAHLIFFHKVSRSTFNDEFFNEYEIDFFIGKNCKEVLTSGNC